MVVKLARNARSNGRLGHHGFALAVALGEATLLLCQDLRLHVGSKLPGAADHRRPKRKSLRFEAPQDSAEILWMAFDCGDERLNPHALLTSMLQSPTPIVPVELQSTTAN